MSCYGCSRKYGIFCKEYGCPNCGYSYCAKCLKRPLAVPRKGNQVLNVCLICYDKLSKIQASENVVDCEALPGTIVTKSTLKRDSKAADQNDVDALLGAIEPLVGVDPLIVLTPNTSIDTANTTSTHSTEDNTEIDENLDRVISKRLKNLKTVENQTTDDELRGRLSNLKGMPQKDYSKKDLLLSTDKRTDQEKMKDLLEQFAGEAQLYQRVETERNDAISDIERRLRALRGDTEEGAVGGGGGAIQKATFSTDADTPSDNEQDEETMLKDIMQKYLAEARLPPAPSAEENELMSSIPKPPAGTSSEELPWCNICNEDAVIRCKGCDGELFCAQCFRECHDDDEEYRAHEKVAYTAPPKFKENHF